MSFLHTKGVVIREVNTGEADRIITLFTKNEGKLQGFAKGARRPKSRLTAGTQFLCYGDFILFRGRELYSVNSCDVQETFYEIRNDVVRLTYAAYLVDIVNDIVLENQPSSKILQLFLNSLHVLSKTEIPPELVARIFELKALCILGYAPHIGGCMECGSQKMDKVSFNFHKYGFVCGGCARTDSSNVAVSPGAAKAIRYIVTSRMKDLFAFNLSTDVLDELGRINRRYLREHLEHEYTKLDFLKSL